MISPGVRDLFPLKQTAVYLNHGGFGVAPREVMAARAAILQKIEEAPSPFFAHEYREKWNSTAAYLAVRLGVAADSLALVDNVTDGINAVLRAFAFKSGDEILTTSLTYGAIDLAAEHTARQCAATVVRMPIPFPNPSPEGCLDALQAALTPRTRLAILDHVTSSTALVLPVAEMARICRERGSRRSCRWRPRSRQCRLRYFLHTSRLVCRQSAQMVFRTARLRFFVGGA